MDIDLILVDVALSSFIAQHFSQDIGKVQTVNRHSELLDLILMKICVTCHMNKQTDN